MVKKNYVFETIPKEYKAYDKEKSKICYLVKIGLFAEAQKVLDKVVRDRVIKKAYKSE